MAQVIPMDANDLLAVSPKLLAQAILHRRERLADMIPQDLEGRKKELLNENKKKMQPMRKSCATTSKANRTND